MFKEGFDNQKYIQLQTEKISERISQFGGKLYLEFGGKLFDDYHASRVLPGFKPDSKLRMLLHLKDMAEIVIVVSAAAIEQNKMRADLGITYDIDALRLIDAFREEGLYVGSVCITQYSGQASADAFINRLHSLGIKVFRHYHIDGYPTNVKLIVSEDGYGKNEYIETSRELVVITAPGPGSGKMAVCLSQLYQDSKKGIKSGYAKFETFPVWNLSLTHPVNIAYEAATVDLSDVNMIDPFHLEAYGTTSVNYNRDVEIFPVLRRLFEGIYGECPYKSPTDMGVNMVGNCIYDDEAVSYAAKMEVIRRYYDCLVKKRKGKCSADEVYKSELIMNRAKVTVDDRRVVRAALDKAAASGGPSAAIELPDGRIVTGRTSDLLGSSSAALLNALKTLSGIDDSTHLISPSVIEPICALKTGSLGSSNPRLHADEILIALAICAATDPNAKAAYECIPQLAGCEVHTSVIVSSVDSDTFRRLGMNLTQEPVYETKKLFHK
ncbi:MAG: DUF1846 domain-containing protein [Clostridia bacterium]|nr:DUF1846 domain-containing protein [Clostridia bacterium]MBQ8368953.1 DUF1846 domain-containing protein [Clostridia bacterium]